MAVKLNIIVDQGTDFEVSTDVQDENGAVLGLSSYEFTGQLRAQYDSERYADITRGVGTVTGSFSPSETLALPGDSRLRWSLRATDEDDAVETWVSGWINTGA